MADNATRGKDAVGGGLLDRLGDAACRYRVERRIQSIEQRGQLLILIFGYLVPTATRPICIPDHFAVRDR